MKNTKPKAGSLLHDVTFTPKDFQITDGGRCVRMRRGGSTTNRIGWPALPIDIRRLALPYGATGVSVRVVQETWKPLRRILQLAPVQPLRLASDIEGDLSIFPPIPKGTYTVRDHFEPSIRVAMDEAVFGIREVAAPTAELRQVDYLAGNAVASIQIAPLRWMPRSGRAHYLASVTLEVRWLEGAVRKPVAPRAALDEIRRLLPMVDNPMDVKRQIDVPRTFDDMPDICPEHPQWTRFREPGLKEYPVWKDKEWYIPPDILFPFFDDYWPYLIITDDTRWGENGTKGTAVQGMTSAFQRLAEWKSAKGIPARVITVSAILANEFGPHWVFGETRDVQEAIRNFLQYAYAMWGTRWLLLGGDIDIVPIRHVLGDWGNRISVTSEMPPGSGSANHGVGTTTMNYHAPFVFDSSQLIFGRMNGTIAYRADASGAVRGWYYAADDTFSNRSATPTEWVVICAPAAVLEGDLVLPHYGSMIPTDLYYASIAGPLYQQDGKHDWDLDGNLIYGWNGDGNLDGVDFGCDVSVGRAPVDCAADAETFVDKVITYETFRNIRDQTLLDGEFPRRYLGVGDVWGSNWWDGTTDKSGDADMDGASYEKNLALKTLRSSGVDVDHNKRLLTDLFFEKRIATDLAPLTTDNLRDAVEAGPHFVSVSGHGWWGGCCNFASNDYNYVDARAMTNWPNNGIYFVDSCLTNEIDADKWRPPGQGAPDPNAVCFGKRVIRVSGGGAVGYVGYSRVGAVGNTQEQEFWRTLSTPGQRRLGRMHDRAREIGSTRVFPWQIFVMNLNGDPEMGIWTRAPRRITVSHTATVYGGDHLTVSVFLASEPLLNANVCVSQIGENGSVTYFNVVEAVAGHYTFDTAAAKDGELTVVVSGENLIPHVASVQKVSLPKSPKKHYAGSFVYDLAATVNGTASVVAARGDGRIERLGAITLDPVWTTTLRNDGKPLVSLAVSGDGSTAVATREAGGDNVHLVSSAGSVERSWALGKQVMRVERSGDGNVIYAATIDAGLRALSRTNGTTLWSDMKHAFHVIAGPMNRIYAAGVDTDNAVVVVCFESNGSRRWTYTVGSDWVFEPRSFIVHDDGRCVVGTRNRELHAVDDSGNNLWKNSNPSASVVSLARAGNMIVAGRGDGSVERYALADGTLVWSTDIGDRADALLVCKNRVYVGAWHGVYALALSDGSVQWLRETQGGVLSLSQSGRFIYAGSRDGWVYRIDVSVPIKMKEIRKHPVMEELPYERWPGIRKPSLSRNSD